VVAAIATSLKRVAKTLGTRNDARVRQFTSHPFQTFPGDVSWVHITS